MNWALANAQGAALKVLINEVRTLIGESTGHVEAGSKLVADAGND
ncbi:hypothetical protein ACFPTO_23475 [Paraburkholderia denitrificans]|uniref:Uncharacterized protein n=1 Tax=Paraburkholderia denitrificans TaxID=694025 RepID=A0ABW0JEV3_9BURK